PELAPRPAAVDPVAAGTQGGQLDGRGAGLAEHDVGAAGPGPVVSGLGRADQLVRRAVTVDVTGIGDRVARRFPTRVGDVVAATAEGGHVDGRGRRLAEDQVCADRVGADE